MGRFEATRPFDLWILIHVWDYISRADGLHASGVLPRHRGPRRKIALRHGLGPLIRLGRRWPVVYLPEVLAQSREYRQTKTASGGWRRFRELRFILARSDFIVVTSFQPFRCCQL